MADTDWSQFSPVNQPASGETDWSNFSPADAPKKQNKGIAADLVTDVKRGVQQLPGAVTGLVDIPVSLVTGSPLVSGLADKAGEITGFQPSKWAKSAEAEYSPSRQAGRAEVDNAWEQGTVSDIAGAYLKNPMNIVGSVAESIPSMLVGGLAGRAALGIGAKTVSAGAGGVGAALPGVIARTVGTSMAPAVGAGIGEGGIMAGQAMQNSLDAGVDPRTAAGYAGATGLIGGALGTLGGKVAQKFGVVDPETLIAGGIGRQASNATGMAAAKEVGKRVAGGAISEGLFEELPQSVFEQGFQNLAQDKPLTEGMARAGVEGALAGSFMGGAFNAIPGGRYAESKINAQAKPQDEQQPIAGLLPSPTYTGTPGSQIVENDAARQAAVDAADKNAADLYAMRDAFEAARQNVVLVADPVPVQQRIDAMLGLDTARMDKKGRALYEKDLAAAFNEQIGITHDANQREVPFTMGEYLDAQVKTDDAVRARERIPAQNANQQSVTRLGVLAEEEAQQQVALTQDLARSAAQGGALSKAALSGMATGATQMPVHPMRAAIEQQMLSDEAAQAELAPIQRQMQSRSTEQVRRIAENEKAIPKIRQAAIADLQRRMATQAQPTTTSPLQQTATRFDMPAQSGIKQLQAQLEQADPFSEQSGVLIEKLQSAVTQDAQSALSAGQMPVYKVTDQVSVAIHPSAQNPGMVQVTRYTKDGVIGDSQYNNVDEAVRQEGLTHKPRIASNEAAAVIEQSIQAEAGYQQRMAVAPATPESQKADNRAKLEKARAKNVGPQSRDDLVGAILRVTGGNGIHPKMAQTIVGDKAKAATKVRGLFTLRGQEDLDDIAELLRIQENYDVRDGNHLAELVRQQAGGDPVYSMERVERDAAENEVRKHRDDIRRRAAELGIRTAVRKFDDVERDVLEAEAKQAQDEAVAERDAIHAEEAVSELDDDKINVLLDLATQENKENGRYINEQWISNDEILDAFDGTEALEEPEDADGAARAGEAVAGEAGGNRQERGQEARPDFGLAAQTNAQAAEQFAQQQAGEPASPTKEQADRERDAVPFSLGQQSQPKPQGVQAGMLTADGRASADAQQKPAEPVAQPKPERGEVGASLTKEQRKSVLKTLADVYRQKNAPRESKGVDSNGNERSGYAYSPDLFEKSDITGAMVRYYVTLPDGRIAHPTELFADYTQSDIDAAMQKEIDADRNRDNAEKFERARLLSLAASTIVEANGKFNHANRHEPMRDYVPVLLTNGELYLRSRPENADKTAKLLGDGWRVEAQPKAEPAKAQEPAAKEPWQMTSAEFDAAKKRVHWPMVKEHGRIVPASKGVNAHFELNDDAPADIKTMNAVMNVSNHESAVSKAVREGKPVPANVLADYPDLKPATVDAVKPAKSEPSEMDALKAEMGQAIGELASILGVKQNLTPEEESRIIPVMSKIFRIAAKMGYIKFKDAAKYVLGQIRQLAGNDVADKISIDNLQAGYINIAKEIGGDKREAMSYDSIEDLEKADATDQRSSTDLERDSRDAKAQDGLGEEGVRAGRDGDGGTGRPGVQGGEESIRAGSGGELRGPEAAAAGERGDLEIYTGAPELSPGSAGNRVDRGSRDSGLAGAPVEPDATKAIGEAATKQSELVANKAEQARADKTVAHKGGIAAIRDALPILTEGQQEDVAKAETRFAVPDGYGMLFTNGTGTGKTFTGLGAIKRLANQGKTNILIVAPNDKIVEDWQKAGKLLGLDISRLADTNDAGNGIVITTHANMGQNNALASREWDLVVSDEAHYLAMGKDGANTNALKTLRAITLHPDGVHHRYAMLNAGDIERLKQLDADAKMQRTSDDQRNWHAAEKTQADADKLRNELKAKQDAIKADVAERQGEKRPRALFLSATPFAYEKTVDWANGYLFDYNEGRSNEEREFRGYNEGSNLDQFMMQHFGYRMRYGKLTQPDAKVDSGLMQRQFNTWLKKKGSLSGRMLDVAADYDRRFILVDSAIGQRIDDALEWFETKRKAQRQGAMDAGDRIGRADPYESALSAVRDQIGEKFDYLSRRYLLESIKAREVVPHVREHLAMGRKVVVFHDYKKGGGFNPFLLDERSVKDQEAVDATIQAAEWNRVVREFNAEFMDIINSDLFRQSSPIDMFKAEFPGVLLFNGDVPAKTRRDNVAKFQDDASGPQVILVQSAAGKEGISLHDTTGKHQRVLFNLGQPTQPTTAIQQEGRIYRTGQVTDAIFRYLNTGTNWEKWAFATTIAQRASAAENLGMGEQARALKDAFISGFEESADYRAGMEDEGKGGKARDKAANDALTEYDRARAFYFGTQKKNSKTKAQEGADYFATPEPVGLKMVEWADIRPGEKVLEPSAGHGAIARWIPDSAEKTAIEPSMTLRPRLAMVFDGQIIGSDFESLNVVNKYDAIVMNPPFGSGGKTAVDHIAKAATHLRDGGRIVALLPTGPAADKKFDKWMYEGETRQMKPLYTHPELGPIYENDTLTVNSFGSDLKISGPLVIDGSGSGPRFVRPKGESKSTAVNLVALKSITPGNRTEIYRPAEGIYMVADIKMPAVTFERAGTQVMTRIVVLEKQSDATKAPNGGNKIDLSDIGDINELFKRVEYVGFQNRPKVDAQEAGQAPANDRPQKAKPAAVGDVVTVNGSEYAIEIYTTNDGKEKRGIWMEEKEAKEINPRAFKSSKMRGTPAEGKFFVDEYWLNKRNGNSLMSRGNGTQTSAMPQQEAESRIKSILGDKLGKVLIDSGIVTFTNKGNEYQGATYKDGSIVLNLDALSAENFDGVFFHEGFHSTIRELVGEQTYTQMMKRLENMGTMGNARQWFSDAEAAIPGNTKAENRTEELAAYAVEQYTNGTKQPNVIRQWVESLLSALRTAIIRRLPFGKLKTWAVNNLQPQDLANLAIAGLRAKAQGQLQAQGREAMAYSRNEGVQSSYGLPNEQLGNRAFDRAEIRALRRLAAGMERPEAGITFRITDDGIAIATGPKGTRVPERYIRFANDNGLSFESRRLPISGGTEAPAMPAIYRTDGALYFGEMASNARPIDRTGKTRFSKINQTDTPEFKKWFGDSKVVDADGNPLVVYHATTYGDFNEFTKEEQRKGMAGFGFYFSDRYGSNVYAEHSQRFKMDRSWKGEPKQVNTMPVFLRMENPLLADNIADVANRFKDQGAFGVGRKVAGLSDDAKTAIQRAGYDGVITNEYVRKKRDGSLEIVSPHDKGAIKHPVYVVFEPTQVKSAIGNNGQFDGTNPDIRYSRAQIIGDSGRQYDQTQRQFFKNVGRDIEKKNLVERTTEYLKNDFWKKMAVGIVDQFRGLRDLGDNGQAYMLARLSKGTAGAFDALLHHGKLSIRDGVYDADTSGGFIDRLGTPLHGELDDFLWYVAANRAEGLSKVDRENLFTPADIAAGKSLAKGQTNFDYTIQTGPQKGTTTRNRTLIYADANRVFNEFQKNTLDMAEQSGLIDGASRKLWESEFYVPFYRVSEEDGEFIGAKMGNALVRQQAFKKLKGGTDKLNSDLLSNTLLNFSHLIEASAKNRAAKASLAAAEKIGAADRVAPDMASYAASNGSMLPPGTKGTVWFQENGKKVEYKVSDPFVMTAITSLEYAGMRNGVMDVMTKFKHFLTIGVTASPAFKVRNLIRDSIQSIGASELGYNPIKNITEGYKQTRRDSQEYVSALASGGLIRFGTMLEGSESARVRQLVKAGVKDSTILNSENKWRAFYDQYLDPAVSAYNELGNRSEEINRAALYNQLVKQGKSHAEAALLARDLMDFSMQGSFNTIRFLTQVVPFMNARLQGMYKLGRSAKDNPRKLAVVTGAVALASIALMLAYGDDDDWKRREDWDRDNFWWFKFGDVEFRIPKPFEVGAIGTLAERGLELMIDDEMTGERFRNVVNSLVMNNLSMNPIPQAFKPILDLYANKDSFTKRPIESLGMQRLDPTERFNSNTSMVARGMSKASLGALSPVQIDHLARAYFGWLGSFVIGGADMVSRSVSDEPTKPALDYFRFGTQGILKEVGTGSSRYVTQVYEQAKEIEQAHATYRQMLKDGRMEEAKEYAEDNNDQLIRYRKVESVKKMESNLNERIRKIERSDMDSDQKKDAIALINKQKEQVAKRIAVGA